MIYFFAGFATGAVTALFSVFCLHKAKVKEKETEENTCHSDRSNKEKEERERREREEQRQHENMMRYTGKEQRG